MFMNLRRNFIGFSILLLFVIADAFSQKSKSEFNYVNNLSRYAKVWGLLKYYHPEIAKGLIDWDSVLVNNIPKVKHAASKEEFNAIIIELFDIAGEVEKKDTSLIIDHDSVKRYPDFKWVKDSLFFSKSVIERMKFIIDNKVPFDNYYVQSVEGIGNTSFENEKPYKEMVYPNEEYRLLALFRYWNVIQYFYPYKHLIDRDWGEVLIDFSSKLLTVNNSLSYNLSIYELASNIDDSHAISMSEISYHFWGNLYLPFRYVYFDGNTVITENIKSLNNLQKGDVIKKIDNIPIEEIRDSILKYVSGSNEASKQFIVDIYLARTNKDSLSINVLRNKERIDIKVKSINREELRKYLFSQKSKKALLKWISDDIAYINLALLLPSEVDSIMRKAIESKQIIFDLRGYPLNTIYKLSNYLFKEKKKFALTYEPDLNYPGLFKFVDLLMIGPDSINNNYYKGKIFVLVDVNTQSHGEFTCMALKTAPNVTIIGSQTSGADGNVSSFKLPGNITVRFTGIGIAYPSGEETQRVGIIPDVTVKQNLIGIIREEDQILKKTLCLIEE